MQQQAGTMPHIAPSYGAPMLTHLRAATAAAHARTEAIPALLRLMTPGLTRAEYGVALRGLLVFQAALHRVLPPRLVRLGIDFPLPEARLASLRADLQWLGAPLPPASRHPLAVGRGAAAVGALYVLEGSALGGRVIGRHVQQTLGVTPGRGGDFFCGQDAEAARRRWAELCAVLARLPETQTKRVTQGALAAFAFLDHVFTPRSPDGRLAKTDTAALAALTNY